MDLHAKATAKRDATASRQPMRAFLSALAEAGDLVTIPEAVHLDFELAACLTEADSDPALQFPNVKGLAGAAVLPIVGNLLNSLPRFALGMGSTMTRARDILRQHRLSLGRQRSTLMWRKPC